MEHSIKDYKERNKKIRYWEQLEPPTWCGFCSSIIVLGADAWRERANHIENHFRGWNGKPMRTINEWQSQNNNAGAANGPGLPPEAKRRSPSPGASRSCPLDVPPEQEEDWARGFEKLANGSQLPCPKCEKILGKGWSHLKECCPEIARDNSERLLSDVERVVQTGAESALSGKPSKSDGQRIQPRRSLRISNRQRQNQAQSTQAGPDREASDCKIMKQPETRPISQDQLVAEVKGIYAGLATVEAKCIEVDNAQSSNPVGTKLNNEQWQALIALHRSLLHEHHDFFLASQHPSASPALRRLASKYAMPARMWRHSIHSFLELLRHRLPASLEHLLTFLYAAYSMMALLYETVPEFEDTWIECLADLARYRMAIEDADIKDREVWAGVSRHWYSMASDKSPMTGRLYHHLAILARPNVLQQQYYYFKSLCVPIPFSAARESVMTLFNPVLDKQPTRLASIDEAFVRVHGILFSKKGEGLQERLPELHESMDEFIGQLCSHISCVKKRWLETGYHIGIILGCSLLGCGAKDNILMRARNPNGTDTAMAGSSGAVPDDTFVHCLSFAMRTFETVLGRWWDPSTLPFLHTMLVFISYVSRFPAAASLLEAYPWTLTSEMLNNLLRSYGDWKVHGDLRLPEEGLPKPLPEDFAMRGLLYADHYPEEWFKRKIEEDEKYFELGSMEEERKDRIISLGYKIATGTGNWLIWDDDSRQFSVPERGVVGDDSSDTSSWVGDDYSDTGTCVWIGDDSDTGSFVWVGDG
ncbi:hypothetical protein ACJZ2D_017033 [Fusarium nematophilum]